MKMRFFTIFAFLVVAALAVQAQSTDISSRTEAIYVTGKTVKPGNRLNLSVQMKNETFSARGFQFDLYLPDGMSFAKDEKDKCLVELSTARTTGGAGNYLFQYNVQGDGALRVLCNAWDGTPFTGTTGEICTITVDVDSDAEAGDCPLVFRKITLTNSNANKYTVDDVTCMFNINTEMDDILLYGDVNHDGDITIVDVTIIVNYILGKTGSY